MTLCQIEHVYKFFKGFIMKKSLLALAVASAAFVATSVSATPVYNKDGTSLDIGGRIEALWLSGGAHAVKGANGDSTVRNRARLNIAGRTQINSAVAGYGFAEWQSQNAGDSDGKTGSFASRDQYVGLDFGRYGKVQAGRYEDPFQYASDVTDHFEEYGCMALVGDERNSGKLSYMYSGYGFDGIVTAQFAEDNYASDVFGTTNVNGGFSAYAGYTTPTVGFGPISIRVAYKYLDGQNDELVLVDWDNEKTWAAGLSWGTFKKGLYLAVDYTYDKVQFTSDATEDLKTKAFESIISYGFDSGVVLSTGYQVRKTEQGAEDGTGKLWQANVAYNINPNFRVWAEANIDAGSDDWDALTKVKEDGDGENIFAIGARYTF